MKIVASQSNRRYAYILIGLLEIPSEFTECVFCCPCQGEKLQFVFRNINPSDQDSAYVVTMGIREDGAYQSKLNTFTVYHKTILLWPNFCEV